MRAIRLALSLTVALHAGVARGAGESFSVDESTGEGVFTYRPELPPARGRYQPQVVFTNRTGTAPVQGWGACDGTGGWDFSSMGIPSIGPNPDGGTTLMYLVSAVRRYALVPSPRGTEHYSADVENGYMDFVKQPDLSWTATDGAGNRYTFGTQYLQQVVDLDGNVTRYTRSNVGVEQLQEIAYNSYTRADGTRGFATRVSLTGDIRYGADLRTSVEYPDPLNPAAMLQRVLRKYSILWATDQGLWTNPNRPPDALPRYVQSIVEYGGESGPTRASTFGWQPGAFSNCRTAWAVTQLGARHDLAYASSDGGTGGNGKTYGVVSKLTRTGPGLATATTRFWYSGPLWATRWYDARFQDYRGFSQSWSQDDTTGIVRHTWWEAASGAFEKLPAMIEYGTGTYADAAMPPSYTAFRAQKWWHNTRPLDGAKTCPAMGASPGAAEVVASDHPVIPYTQVEQDIRYVDGLTLTTQRTTACADIDAWGNVKATIVDPDAALAGDEYVEGATHEAAYETPSHPVPCKECVREEYRTDSAGVRLEATRYTYTPTFQVATVSGQVSTAGTWAQLSSLTWKANGNLESKTEGAVTTTFTYDPAFQLRVTKQEVSQPGTSTLVTDTHHDDAGRPDLVAGPYLAGGVPGPTLATAYDAFHRPRLIARQISGTAVTGALAAFEYFDFVGATPAFTRSYTFSVPRDLVDPSIPTSADVIQTVSHVDGLGRDIQVRQRMAGSGAADAGASISQNLTGYLVAKAVVYDGIGRAKAALEPYYSASGAYLDLQPASATIDASAGQSLHATLFTYDAQGRQTCSVRRFVSTALPAPGACVSSFAENASHALATLTSYRASSLGGKVHLGVKTVPPENNFGSSPAGPESFHDAAGWLRRTTDVDGNSSVVLYDRLGRKTGLQRIPAANGTSRPPLVSSSATLDLMGRAATLDDPNFGKRTITYDPVSPSLVRKITFTRTGDELSYTYDKGRVATVKQCKAPIPSGPCTTDTLAYDAPYQPTGYDFTAGRLSWVANGATTIALGYDRNGATARRDQWFAGQGGAFSALATVRSDGRPVQTSLLAPALATFTQAASYDSLGRPAGLASGTTSHWAATNVAANTGAYDAAGRLLGAKADADRVVQAWSFGAGSGLLSSQSVQIPGAANSLVYSVGSMTYRGTRLAGYTDTVSQTTYGYWYSPAGRLVAAKATPAATHPLAQSSLGCFSHNLAKRYEPGASYGNLEKVVERFSGPSTAQEYGYSGTDLELGPGWAGPDAVTSLSSSPVGGTERFEYDLLNRLVAVTRTNGPSEKLWYDPSGGIVTRQVGSTVISYVGNQATVTGTLNAGCSTPSCGVTVTSVDAHLLLGGKRLGSVRLGASSRTVYLHRDRLGSVVATTLAGGQAGASYRYAAYGALEVASGDAGNAASEIGYAGALRLTGGLLLMGARVYHPGLKTFLQTDPLEPYRYDYAGADPVNRIDPSGLKDVAYSGLGGWLNSLFTAPQSQEQIDKNIGSVATIPRWLPTAAAPMLLKYGPTQNPIYDLAVGAVSAAGFITAEAIDMYRGRVSPGSNSDTQYVDAMGNVTMPPTPTSMEQGSEGQRSAGTGAQAPAGGASMTGAVFQAAAAGVTQIVRQGDLATFYFDDGSISVFKKGDSGWTWVGNE